ncbi:MAG: LysR family transcriptional regulator [Rhodobiaceae bacterium]|nr:LysR family transcriptional regulator [Rhodobiaceae bacterium]MCC0016215.1 LysR family transcriptional regulator [Rhodobiaceae bacterium]MCC0041180.1 LysR family transcriptional regulator [Rhodobiaceae bacterium]
MDLRQIDYFLAACGTLNFTRAAEACDVAVPTLTRAIKALEDELGGQLFRRERHLTHLTDLGRLMQRHLSEARNAADRAVREAERFSAADTRLRLGVVSTMASSRLVAYLRRLREQAPELELHVWEANCEELESALAEGELDVAIATRPEYADPLRANELYREFYFVAFPPGHRFAAMNAVPLAEIDGEPYIKRLHCEFPSNFARLGVPAPYKGVQMRFMSEREDWVQSMVAAGLGITLMPQYLPLIADIEMRPVIEPEVYRTVSIVTVAGRPHAAPVKAALDAARSLDWS